MSKRKASETLAQDGKKQKTIATTAAAEQRRRISPNFVDSLDKLTNKPLYETSVIDEGDDFVISPKEVFIKLDGACKAFKLKKTVETGDEGSRRTIPVYSIQFELDEQSIDMVKKISDELEQKIDDCDVFEHTMVHELINQEKGKSLFIERLNFPPVKFSGKKIASHDQFSSLSNKNNFASKKASIVVSLGNPDRWEKKEVGEDKAEIQVNHFKPRLYLYEMSITAEDFDNGMSFL